MSTIKEILHVFGGPHAVAQYERESRESAAANWELGYDACKRGEQRHNPYRTVVVVGNSTEEEAICDLVAHTLGERCTNLSCPYYAVPHHHPKR